MARQIMIVGNGDIPEGLGAVIDAAEVVIRFNTCRSYGVGGTRTDVVAVCNTGRPAREMLDSPDWRDSPPIAECAEIWSVRDSVRFREMAGELAVTRTDLHDFCDDYTGEFAAFGESRDKHHHVIGAEVHERLDELLGEHGAGDYVTPSSGLLVIGEILSRPDFAGDSVSIAGFAHKGWNGHPFAAEKRLIDSFESDGRIARLRPDALSSPPASTLEGI